METLEQKALQNGGSLKIDLDAGPDSEWCMILVTPAMIEKIREIAARIGKTPDEVLMLALTELDKQTKESSRGG